MSPSKWHPHTTKSPDAIRAADVDLLRKLYFDEQKTCAQIAETFNCGVTTVKRHFRKLGFQMRDTRETGTASLLRFNGTPAHLEAIKESSVRTIRTYNETDAARKHIWEHVTELNTNRRPSEQMRLVFGLRSAGWNVPDGWVNYPLQICEDRWYYPDIADVDVKLCIEVDGYYHTLPRGKRLDATRDSKLKKIGWLTVRYTTTEINQDLNKVVTAILKLRATLHERQVQEHPEVSLT